MASPYRTKFTTGVEALIRKSAPDMTDAIIARIAELERLCFEECTKTTGSERLTDAFSSTSMLEEYQRLYLKIVRLMQPRSALVPDFISGNIDLLDIVRQSSVSLNNTHFINHVKNEIGAKQNASVPKVVTTDTVQCKKCGKRNATYYSIQKRSGDEPATVYYTCIDCGNSWTVNN